MSERDDEIERAIELIRQCDTPNVVRWADELENSLEPGSSTTLALVVKNGHTSEMTRTLREAYEDASA